MTARLSEGKTGGITGRKSYGKENDLRGSESLFENVNLYFINKRIE